MADPVLPQFPVSANAEVLSVEWLFEPLWPGTRVIATVERGDVTLSDELGRPVEGEIAHAADVLAAAILADHAVVDGVWSAQPFIGDGSQARVWADTLAEQGLENEVADPIHAEKRRAFVAVDLVELDGEPLHDVPFQERRRLLESVIDEGVQVRLSPVVKHPLASWLIGWRANGFSHYLAKHMNSHYLPGERNDDWLKLSLRADAPRGMIGRLVGTRERIRRIRD
ncbi:MAG: ATP-dependent DNA ligase [Candidatus Limnocylindria bacterium]